MDKEEFKIKLIESQIYEELKDSPFPGLKYLQGKYQGLKIDISKVYRKIVNYQVKKYGESLTSRRYWMLYSKNGKKGVRNAKEK